MAISEITGGCLCGVIRYRAVGRPVYQTVCHCGNCRRATGSQAVAWVTFLRADFAFVTGTPKQFGSDSGATWSFCEKCGTTLLYQHDERRPNDLDITVGSLDNPEGFPPNQHVFEDEKLSWV